MCSDRHEGSDARTEKNASEMINGSGSGLFGSGKVITSS